MNLTEESRSKDAVKVLLDDLERLNRLVEDLEGKLAEARERRAKLVRSIEFLRSNLLGADEANVNMAALLQAHKSAKPLERISPAARLLIDTLKGDARRTWRVEELQDSLRQGGEGVSDKYASNTLRKLYAQGLVTRVGRGLYRVNETLFSFEGFTEEDLEE